MSSHWRGGGGVLLQVADCETMGLGDAREMSTLKLKVKFHNSTNNNTCSVLRTMFIIFIYSNSRIKVRTHIHSAAQI